MKYTKLFFVAIILSGILSNNIAFSAVSSPPKLDCPEFPFFEPKTGPLARTNCDFHHAYEFRMNQIKNNFGAVGGRPVILNVGGTLILKYNGKTEKVSITPPAYHNIKSFGHVAFSVYLILSRQTAGTLNTETKTVLLQLQEHLHQAMQNMPSLNLNFESFALMKQLAIITDNFLTKVLKENTWNHEELNAYYVEVRPLITQSIKIAAQLEISTLDITVNHWISQMTPDEIKQLGIVVATSHQARAHEISADYFANKFGYKFGVGALHENGFVIIEDKFDENDGLKALARHYLDRESAQVIFNNPDRLQWDLLSQVENT